MKKIILSIFIAGFSLAHAQVVIGTGTVEPGDKTSVLLEFTTGENKGIIIPYVRTIPSGNALIGGSIILDATSPNVARVRYYNAVLPGWVDLSGQNANISTMLTNTQPDPATNPLIPVENAKSRVIIGDVPATIPANFPEGVLVLNSTTKAMILPKVGTVVELGITKPNISNPSPGMMAFVTNSVTGAKTLAVFNGAKWSYWKP